jgi:hypothetical protein
MSAIASFYLVRDEDMACLKDLATQPVGPIAGGQWHDPYWEFLFANARELEQYEWSGYVIGSEVYFYLQSRSVTLDDYCDKELSDFFCEARGSTVLIFRAAAGKELARLIECNWPDEGSLVAFLNSADMASPIRDVVPVGAVFDGLRVLKSWLSQVDERNLGLLSIG